MFGLTPQEKDLLYRTVAAEAGGEPAIGQQGVVHTILNRARSGQYPSSVGAVIRQPGQFSALNHLTGYAGGKGATPRFFEPGYKVNPSVIQNVDAVLAGDVDDPTGGALNYYNPAAASPKWGPGMANPVTIGAHRFGTAGGKMDPIRARINQGFSHFDDDVDRTVNNIGPAPQPEPVGMTMGASNAQQGGLGGFFDTNRGALMGLGIDLIRRGLDTRKGFTGRNTMLGRLSDEKGREDARKRAQAAEQRNMTAEWLRERRPDLYEAVSTGAMPLPLAWQEAMKSPSAPNVETFYDDQGRPYKAQWSGQGWQRVGGSKSNQPLVNIINTPDGAEPLVAGDTSKILTETDKKLLTSADEAAQAVAALNTNLNAAEAILDSGFKTGLFAPASGQIARGRAAVGLGGDDQASQFEQLDAVSKELATEGLKAFGGSDTERELMVSMQATVGPGKTEAANRAIIDRKRKGIEILQTRPDFLREWIRNFSTTGNPSTAPVTIMGVEIPEGLTSGEAWREYQKIRWENEAPEMPSESTSTSSATQPAITREQAIEELMRRGELP